MDISNLITHVIGNCPSIAQTLKAESIDREFVDTSAIIYSLVQGSVSDRAYPSRMPGNKTYPALVYNLVSSNKVTYSQFNILQTDVFVLFFQAKTYSEIMTLRQTIKTALVNYNPAGLAGDIEITDESIQYLYDQDLHQCALELNIVHLNGSDQSLPAVFVYESANSTSINEAGALHVAQLKDVILNFIIIAKHSDLETIKTELQSALLGYSESTLRARLEHSSGNRLESLVNVSVWDEQYRAKLSPLITN